MIGQLHEAFGDVDVWVGAVAHEHVDRRAHEVGHVGVEVEDDADGHGAAHLGAQRCEVRAVGVEIVSGASGSVAQHGESVERPGVADGLHGLGDDGAEVLTVEWPSGAELPRGQVDDHYPCGLQAGDQRCGFP